MTAAEVLRDAFWAALPATSKWRQRQSPEADDALFAQLAEHGRAAANAAHKYGDKGEALIRKVAEIIAVRFWDLIRDSKAQRPRDEADRIADARVWVAATRALLMAAHAERRAA